jgi:hypothetical protein
VGYVNTTIECQFMAMMGAEGMTDYGQIEFSKLHDHGDSLDME